MLSVSPVHLCSRRVGSATINVSTELIFEETTAGTSTTRFRDHTL
jgi:hypothetical protein